MTGRQKALKRYNNSETRKEYMRQYYQDHVEECRKTNRESMRGYRERNKDKIIQKRLERRESFKRLCIQYLGGECLYCGLQDDCVAIYDFHHRDPTKKDIALNTVSPALKNFESIKAELDKCDLLCAVCHRKVHAKSDCCRIIPPHQQSE